jgi:hypothetical protein
MMMAADGRIRAFETMLQRAMLQVEEIQSLLESERAGMPPKPRFGDVRGRPAREVDDLLVAAVAKGLTRRREILADTKLTQKQYEMGMSRVVPEGRVVRVGIRDEVRYSMPVDAAAR